MSGEDLQRAKSCLKVVKGHRVQRGKHIAKRQLRAMLASAVARQDKMGLRDACAIVLMSVGLRRNEVAMVEYDDFDSETGRLIVRGKGNKERTLYLNNGSLQAVRDWVEVRGNTSGRLLCAIDKGGGVKHKGLSQQAVYLIFQKHAKSVGVDCSPHSLRRTFATEMLNAGVDVFTLQQLLGHSNPSTTQKYDLRGEETKAQAMGLVQIPYGRWG